MKQWANWLRAMQDQHDFMSYRQDLPGYGEPAEGHWDGYQRINSDSCSGGVVGVFRQNAKALPSGFSTRPRITRSATRPAASESSRPRDNSSPTKDFWWS